MKIAALKPKISNKTFFAQDIRQNEYYLHNSEILESKDREIPAKAPMQITTAKPDDIITEDKIDRKIAIREAQIGHIKELTGALNPASAHEVRPKKEYKKGEKIDVCV